jgi:hypothetical protein
MEAFFNHVKSTNLPLHNVLKTLDITNTVNLYTKLEFLGDVQRHAMIMNDIKNTLQDVKLILNNGTILVNKAILSIIPYFKDMFEDCDDFLSEVSIDASYEAMTIIINSVYFDHIKLDNKNIIEVLCLMDMFRYNDHLRSVIYFLYDQSLYVIHKALKEKNVNQLVLLEMVLRHMLIYGSDQDKIRINKILTNSFRCCTDYMFSFSGWYEMFTVEQQLDNIMLTKKYEMFNKMKINPKTVLKYLIDALPENDVYYDVYESKNVYYNINNINYDDSDFSYIIIKSYYPQFHYISIKNFDYERHNIKIENNTFKIILYKSLNITIGSKLIITKDKIDLNDIYEITYIHKIINDVLIPTTRLTYLTNMIYMITLDKPLMSTDVDFWHVQEFCDDVYIKKF